MRAARQAAAVAGAFMRVLCRKTHISLPLEGYVKNNPTTGFAAAW
jgi:hypothetical protein